MKSRKFFYFYVIVIALFNISFITSIFSPKWDEIIYTFEENAIESTSTEIDFIDEDFSDPNCTSIIGVRNNGSNQVLELKDINKTGKVSIKNDWGSHKKDPIIEFDVGKSDEKFTMQFFFSETGIGRIIWLQIYKNDLVSRESGSNWTTIKSDFLNGSNFTHIRLELNDRINNFTIYINGTEEGSFKYDKNSDNGVDYFQIETTQEKDKEYSVFIDNIRYRWFPIDNVVYNTIFSFFEVIFLLVITFILISIKINKRKHQDIHQNRSG